MREFFISTIGQDSHKIASITTKPLILGGVEFEDAKFCLEANSDGDVVLHAIANAISGFTGVNVLGKIADNMCKSGITSSRAYVEKALEFMNENAEILHVSISIEAWRPKFAPKINQMRSEIANILHLHDSSQVCITATTGEQLTEFGKGNGIFVTVIMSFSKIV